MVVRCVSRDHGMGTMLDRPRPGGTGAADRTTSPGNGFRPRRTGMLTLVTATAHDDRLAAERLERHSHLNTTRTHYIDVVPEET